MKERKKEKWRRRRMTSPKHLASGKKSPIPTKKIIYMYKKKKKPHEVVVNNKSLYCEVYIRLSVVGMISELVSWCFEPCQPQRITSGLPLV